MSVMWFRASDTAKPTFSKCFVVLSVMLGGEFSFCFALGQIGCRDRISSWSLEFGIAFVKAEAVWGNGHCQNQEGTEGRKEQGGSQASAGNQCCPESTGNKMPSHAGVPGCAPWSSAWQIRLHCSQQGVNEERCLRFSFPCNFISPAGWGASRWGGAGSGSSLGLPLAWAQDWPCRTGLVCTRRLECLCHVLLIIPWSVSFLYLGYRSSSQWWSIGSPGSFNLWLSWEGQVRRDLKSSAPKWSPPCFRQACNWNQLIPSPLQTFPFQTT